MRCLTTPAILSFLILCSCQEKERPRLHGTYTERSPVNGRSQLHFLDGNKVIRFEPGSLFSDSFHYRLEQGKIILTPARTNHYLPQEFAFEIVDNSSLKIEYLYPSIGPSSKGMMVYMK